MGENVILHLEKGHPRQRQEGSTSKKRIPMSSSGMYILLSPCKNNTPELLPSNINARHALASHQLHSPPFTLEEKILQKWKILSQERGLFCHLRTLAWKSRADGQLLWSFWLECCLRILPPHNKMQSIRLWFIHVIKAFSYKIYSIQAWKALHFCRDVTLLRTNLTDKTSPKLVLFVCFQVVIKTRTTFVQFLSQNTLALTFTHKRDYTGNADAPAMHLLHGYSLPPRSQCKQHTRYGSNTHKQKRRLQKSQRATKHHHSPPRPPIWLAGAMKITTDIFTNPSESQARGTIPASWLLSSEAEQSLSYKTNKLKSPPPSQVTGRELHI